MVSTVRRGASMHSVAETFRTSRSTVRLWVRRAAQKRLDRVDWSDRPSGRPQPCNRTSMEMEDRVLSVRAELREKSALGEYGAEAIHRELVAQGVEAVPAVRTIGRILDRRGVLDGRRRQRRPAPPRGWYLPDVAQARAELDQVDIVEGLVIQGGPEVFVLNAISLHGALAASWPRTRITAKTTVDALIRHWREVGCPAYAQFDNDTRFQGPHQHPDTVGRVSRLCLSLGVTPVFAPPREPGFQGAIESFNGRWQAKVWSRFHHDSLAQLRERSARYVAASRARCADRIAAAPDRPPVPKDCKLDLQAPFHGRLIYLRRTTEDGTADLLGHRFPVDKAWPHRLVRADVDLDTHTISFYALRRREPHLHRLLKTIEHPIPQTHFQE